MGAALRKLGRGSNITPDKFVPKENSPVERGISFSDLAKMAWPEKTEFHLAALLRVDPKTCKRWLGEKSEPPADAAMTVLNEITRLYLTRPR